MEMSQSQLLPVSQQTAWQALNDPDVLRHCIPGCESIEPTAENEFAVAMVAAIGPVKARFQGKLKIEDPDPPRAYKLAFNGQGGAAGFGKGTAEVTLTPTRADGSEAAGPDAECTRLDYAAHAQVGGKIAQIGSRLVDGAARKLAGDFFLAFDALLRERYPEEVSRATAAAAEIEAAEREAVDPPAADSAGSDVPGLIGVQDPTLEPTSRDTLGGLRPPPPIGASRSMRPWRWTAIVVIAALVIWYVTRAH